MKTIIFDLDGTLVNLYPKLVCIADLDRLQELRKEYHFAIVTGSTAAETRRALQETELRTLFDERYIVTIENTMCDKFSGEPFIEILSRLEGEAVMIGDSESDKTGSAIAHLPFVRVKSGVSISAQKRSLKSAIDKALQLLAEI